MTVPKKELFQTLHSWGWVHCIECDSRGKILSDTDALSAFLHLPIAGINNLQMKMLVKNEDFKEFQSLLNTPVPIKTVLSIHSQLPPFPKFRSYAAAIFPEQSGVSIFLHHNSTESAHSSSQRIMDLGLLTAGFFHDFNNQLTSLIFTCEALDQENLKEKKALLKEKLLLIADQSQKMTRYIRDDSTFKHQCSAKKTIETTSRMFQLSLPKSIKLNIQLDFENINVPLSSGGLSHVLLNLLNNAKDAISINKGVIEIHGTVDSKANVLDLSISDDGRGIEKHELPYIFSPFYSSKGKTDSGLGLSISKQILELAGGSITCDNEASQGSIFKIILPII